MGWTLDAHELPETSTARKVSTLPIISGSYQDRVNEFGQGKLVLSADYGRLTDILDPGSDVGSLIWAKYDGTATDLAFFAKHWDEDITDGIGRTLTITGPGIASALSESIVEPYDGTAAGQVIKWGDHIYGGRNIMGNPGLEDPAPINEVYELWNDQTVGGTFTLTPITTATSTLTYDDTIGDIENALETALTTDGITNANALVTGSGTQADPWRIEFVTPNDLTSAMTVTDMTGLTSTLTQTQWGGLSPSPFTESRTLERGVNFEHGEHAPGSPYISTVRKRTGTYSMAFDGLEQFAGVQQIVNVKPGGTYQMSMWANTSDTSATWRLVIRTLGEGFIASSTPFSGTSLSADTWTEFTIADVVIPDGVEQVIIRFAYVGTADPGICWTDDWSFTEGLAAAPAGEIMKDLIDLAQARSSLTWLTYTFTDALDSDGNAWADTLSFTAQHGKSLAHVLRDLARRGIEWRVFWTGSNWELGLYNPYSLVAFTGGIGTDRSSDNAPALIIGQGIEEGPVKFNQPAANVVYAEGRGGLWTKSEHTTSIAAWGRIEAYVRDLTVDDAPTLLMLADAQRDQRLLVQADKVKLNEQAPTPYTDFGMGDTLQTSLPPRVTTKTARRVVGITTDFGFTEHYEVDLDQQVFGPRSSMQEGVRRLLVKFNELQFQETGSDAVIVAGGLPAFTVRVAASDARDATKQAADYICDGTADEVEIAAALDALPAVGGRVVLSEGNFNIDNSGQIILAGRETLEGMGSSTVLDGDGLGGNLITINSSADAWVIKNIRFTGTDGCPGSTVYIGGNGGNRGTIDGCVFAGTIDGPQVDWNGAWGRITNNIFRPDSGLVVGLDNSGRPLVQGNTFDGASMTIASAGTVPTIVSGNDFVNIAGTAVSIVGGATNSFIIEGNSFRTITNNGVVVTGAAGDFDGNSISNNLFDGVGSVSDWVIDLNNQRDIAIVGNLISAAGNGIRVRFTRVTTEPIRLHVASNQIHGTNAAMTITGNAVVLSDETSIIGNTIQRAGVVTLTNLADAVYAQNYQYSGEALIDNCDRIAVTNNIWNMIEIAGTPRGTVLEVKDSDYATIEGNVIYGQRQAAAANHDVITLSGTMTGASVRFNRYVAQDVDVSTNTAYDNGLVIGASVSNTKVNHNDFDDATTGISDSGTGTDTAGSSREAVLMWSSPKNHTGALTGTYAGAFPWAGSVGEVVFTSTPAQSGGTAQCDVNVAGTSVFSTGHPVISDGTQTSGWTVPDGTATGAKGALVQVDIDSASTAADYVIEVRLVEDI